jgi:long-chain acyl-CoA synthetase
MAAFRTIPRLWRDATALDREGPAYLVQQGDHWHEVGWREAATRVDALANGLLSLGVRRGDTFAILGRTSLEWVLFDFALAHVGAVVIPVYANNAPKDVEYVIHHSGAVGVLCEDDAQREKVEASRTRLPELRHILTFGDLRALAEDGERFKAAHPDALDEAVEAIDEEDIYTFIYTSGTTGPPKGCMIRHRNYYAMTAVVDRLPKYCEEGDVMLLYLPLAHNFGRLMHLAGPYVGFTIALLPDPLDAAAAIPDIRPHVLPSVPRVYEKIHSAVLAAFDEETGFKRRIVDWALGVGRRASALDQEGRSRPPLLAVQHAVADRLVLSKVRRRLGGRLRTPISGGAPLAQEIAEFFDVFGIRILEGYGLSECTTAATTNTPERLRYGTVGPALPGFELRLADDGELLIRSETVFAGYYNDPEATAGVLDPDGWLRSGDIAEIDADGFVHITDRKKDILVTAGGKNVAPQNLENDLKSSKYVSQALVVGDRRPYVAALVTLDPVEIGKWAAARGLPTEVSALAAEPQVHALIQEVVDGVNRDRSRFELVRRFAVLPRDFSIEEGEITATLKLRRRAALDHFATAVEELYAASDAPLAERVEG